MNGTMGWGRGRMGSLSVPVTPDASRHTRLHVIRHGSRSVDLWHQHNRAANSQSLSQLGKCLPSKRLFYLLVYQSYQAAGHLKNMRKCVEWAPRLSEGRACTNKGA